MCREGVYGGLVVRCLVIFCWGSGPVVSVFLCDE